MRDEEYEKRGIKPEVREDAFLDYEKDDSIPPEWLWVGDPAEPYGDRGPLTVETITSTSGTTNARAARQPGTMMRRWPVPGGDPFITSEQRPDRAVLSSRDVRLARAVGRIRTHTHSGMEFYERKAHVQRAKTRPEDVRQAVTTDEFKQLRSMPNWDVMEGGDHFSVPERRRHVHVEIGKYLFTANQRTRKETKGHSHRGMTNREAQKHLYDAHKLWTRREAGTWWARYRGQRIRQARYVGLEDVQVSGRRKYPRVEDSVYPTLRPLLAASDAVVTYPITEPRRWPKHEHPYSTDDVEFARRLSWHPWKREERWQRPRVVWTLEGSFKEAACAQAGEATFSCPSVTLWRAPELRSFAGAELRDKVVLTCVDNDWKRSSRDYLDPDAVIRQAILARDYLRDLGVVAYVIAPPMGPAKGADDALGAGIAVDDFVWIDREMDLTLVQWAQRRGIRAEDGRGLKGDTLLADDLVLYMIAITASDPEGLRVMNLQTFADQHRERLEPFLGKKNPKALEQWMYRSIGRLVTYGALTITRPLELNVRRHLFVTEEVQGQVQVHPDLRARTVLRSVREVSYRVPARPA